MNLNPKNNVWSSFPRSEFPNGHLHFHVNRYFPLDPRHEPFRRRGVRFNKSNLHILIEQLHSSIRKALAIYIQSSGSLFLFCAAATVARLSAILSVPWAEPVGQMQLTADVVPLSAKIRVSVEDLVTLPSLDVSVEESIERLAIKVRENLFNFTQSFMELMEKLRR